MASTTTDSLGYVHAAHTLVRETVIAHQVWTTYPDGDYVGMRGLFTYPTGHAMLPDDCWVLVSDFATEPTRIISAATARRLVAAWRSLGLGLDWHETTTTQAASFA